MEPLSIKQALQSLEWTATMQAKIDVLHKNNTWTLDPLPPN